MNIGDPRNPFRQILDSKIIEKPKGGKKSSRVEVEDESAQADALAHVIAQQAHPGLAISAYCTGKLIHHCEYEIEDDGIKVIFFFDDGTAFVVYGNGLHAQFAKWNAPTTDTTHPDVEGKTEEKSSYLRVLPPVDEQVEIERLIDDAESSPDPMDAMQDDAAPDVAD